MRHGVRAIIAGLLAASALVGFASAFALAATAGADTGTTTATTEPPPIEPPTEPPTEPPLPPQAARIAFGVTVGGVSVGGLLPPQAQEKVRKAFERPLVLAVGDTRQIHLSPRALGVRPNLQKAMRRASVARPGATVALHVELSRARIRAYVGRLARSLDRGPVDARIELEGVKPRAISAQPGRVLKLLANARAIRYAFARNERAPIRLAFTSLRPKLASVDLSTAVVILRGSKRLLFFQSEKLVRWFRIAVGLPSYPTPLGTFEIAVKERDPWWNPPPSDWAAGQDPVPPGPGNPLGTRWMGISAPYVGIHGTPDAASIGYSASHGCIRLHIPDAEWLFEQVRVGTPVFILAR